MKDQKIKMFFAALYHDVGKPATTEFNSKTNDVRSIGHELVGAEIAAPILKDFIPTRFHTPVLSMIKHHMIDDSISDVKILKKADELAKQKICWNDLVDIRLADGLGRISEHKTNEDWIKTNEIFRKRIDKLGVLFAPLPALLSGQDLIDIGYPEGNIIGQIRNEIRALQMNRRVNSKEEALEFAKTRLKNINEGKTRKQKFYKIIQDVVRTSFRISTDVTKGIIRKVAESDITDINEAKKLACDLALDVILKRKGLK